MTRESAAGLRRPKKNLVGTGAGKGARRCNLTGSRFVLFSVRDSHLFTPPPGALPDGAFLSRCPVFDPRWIQIITEAQGTMRQHRLRTLLSGLGIVIGVASISAVLAVGDGLEVFVRAQIAETTNMLNIALQPRTMQTVDGRRVPIREEARFVLDAAGLAAVTTGLPGLDSATLWEPGNAEVAFPDTAGVLLSLVGTLPGGLAIGGGSVISGRDFTAADLADDRAVCLLSGSLGTHLVPAADDLGTLTLEGHTFTVVGLLADGSNPTIVVPQPWKARVDIDPSPHALPYVVLQAKKVEGLEKLEDALAARLDQLHPDWRERADVVSYRQRAAQAAQGLRLFKAFMVAITGIGLLVGGIGIMNVLLMSIGERTREIGIRRAMGARVTDIRRQLLVESVLMCGVGALIGTALGIAGAYLIAFVMQKVSDVGFGAAITPSSILIAVGASVLVGLVFGTYPALRAGRLLPVDAIRHE